MPASGLLYQKIERFPGGHAGGVAAVVPGAVLDHVNTTVLFSSRQEPFKS